MAIVFKYRFVILVVETIRWKYSVYIWRGAAIVAFGFPDINSNIYSWRNFILICWCHCSLKEIFGIYLYETPQRWCSFFQISTRKFVRWVLYSGILLFFFFFVYRNEQVCSFLIVESLSEFCIGNFICISGITCELIIWCGCILSVCAAILVSGCPACGPDVVLEFSARVGGWWAQGAKRIGVDEKFGKHFAQHSDRSPSVHDICEVETVVPHV